MGNTRFKQDDMEGAEAHYREGISLCEKVITTSEEENSKADAVKVLMLVNLAQALLKSRQYRASILQCSKALDIDGSNIKALYRRATCHEAVGNLEEAIADLKAAAVVSRTLLM